MKLTKPRFSLKNLLVAVACCAVLFWCSWIAWPQWKLHRSEKRFRELQLGISASGVNGRFPGWMGYSWSCCDNTGSLVEFVPIQRVDYWYCVVIHYAGPDRSQKSVGLDVYRLDVPSESYQAQTANGNEWAQMPAVRPQQKVAEIYFADFAAVLLGWEENTVGVGYKQIWHVSKAAKKD